MPRLQRDADVVWEGNVARGNGTIQGGTGALSGLPFSLPTRIGDPEGKTSPEELVAAAEAACFAMSLSGVLTRAGTPPARLEANALVTVDEVDGSHRIVTIDVTVVGDVPGIDEETFQRAAREAEAGCTISNALRAGAEINLDARLASDSA
jgi:osmotically inducible protein OsmC